MQNLCADLQGMDVDFEKNIVLMRIWQILIELGHDVWMLKYFRICMCQKKMVSVSYLKKYMGGYGVWTFHLIVLLQSFEKNIAFEAVGQILTEIHTIVRPLGVFWRAKSEKTNYFPDYIHLI